MRKPQIEFAVFIFALAAAAALIVGGIFYFKLPINIPTSPAQVAPSQPVSVPQNNPETIPTSTIVVPAVSTSSAPAALRLPYAPTSATMNTRYWPKAWGDISFADDNILLTPDPTTHGANSFLNGASSWTNYAVNVNASSLAGGWFDIVARVSNNTQNFVYCEFGPNGTEVIERVNGNDTQIAFAAASTTGVAGAVENFGMKVYGNNIACMMANQEVVGAQVQDNRESATGGIGFVIFGQPQQQEGGVALSNISVTALKSDTITVPFPVAPVVSTAPSSPAAPPPPAVTPTPALALPYSATTFNAADWGNGWGTFSTASGTFDLETDISDTSAGIFLNNSASWTDYKFTAYVQWLSGQVFDLVARRADGGDLLECVFSEIDSSDTNVSINMISNGQTVTLSQGDSLVTPSSHLFSIGFPVSMEVQGQNVRCDVDNQTISADIPSGLLTQGGIGFIIWDPQQGNSQILVNEISVVPL
jgi:hypothetical protein